MMCEKGRRRREFLLCFISVFCVGDQRKGKRVLDSVRINVCASNSSGQPADRTTDSVHLVFFPS